MKHLCIILFVLGLIASGCGSGKNKTNEAEDVNVEFLDSMVVSILSVPPGAEKAANGTGIVVDKKNGLILTARHGVYSGNELSYKSKNLFKDILVTDKDQTIQLEGRVAHISDDYDLAIIKVDHQFPAQALFTNSGFLKIRDKIEFRGYPAGQYGTYGGNIANISDKYLNLDMTIVGGMSGGPVIVPGKGIVGVVLLKQEVGGNALKAGIIRDYLKKAIPPAKTYKTRSYDVCLKKIVFNDAQTRYNEEKEPDLYFQLFVNDKEILDTKAVEVTGNQMQWENCMDNKFRITLSPGDKLEFTVLRRFIFSAVKETVLIRKIFEQTPQKGMPDLTPEIVIDGNRIIFETIK